MCDNHGYPNQTQQDWVARLLRACPAAAKILDAPADRPVLLDGGRGRARGIAVALDLVRLQELPYVGEYDAVVTIYAMGNVPPEDWPLVLANLHRATRPGSLFDLTVEEAAEPVIEEAFTTLTRRGLPAVRGEVIDGDVAVYHYYSSRDRVAGWLHATRLADHRRGLQPRRWLGLPPFPAAERQAVVHPIPRRCASSACIARYMTSRP